MKKLVRKALTNQKGLTLIELLAVVVILGIIAAIAVPMIGGIIQDSREKAFASEAMNIISAAKIAQATGETGPWSSNIGVEDGVSDLANYITTSDGVTWTSVTYVDGVFTITGLAGTNMPSELDTDSTEIEIARYLGNSSGNNNNGND